ncbi:hypothetical protein D3C76_1309810 [compost metagenome]
MDVVRLYSRSRYRIFGGGDAAAEILAGVQPDLADPLWRLHGTLRLDPVCARDQYQRVCHPGAGSRRYREDIRQPGGPVLSHLQKQPFLRPEG